MTLHREREETRGRRPRADARDNRWDLQGAPGDPGPNGAPEDAEARNTAILRGTALLTALCVLLATPQPDPLFAPMVSAYLFAASAAAMLWALIGRQRPLSPTLTRWDQAALLLAGSLFAGLFTDPDAARQAVESLRQAGEAAGGAGASGDAPAAR
eukprot:g276.t1